MIFEKNNILKLSIIIYLSLISCGCNVITKKDTSIINISKQKISMIARTVDYGDESSKSNLPISDIKAGYFIRNKTIYIQIIYNQNIKAARDKGIIAHGERITVLMKANYDEGTDVSNISAYLIRVQFRPQAGKPSVYQARLTKNADTLYLSAILKLTQFDLGIKHKVTLDIRNLELKKARSFNSLTGLLIPYDREIVKKYYRDYLE